MNLYHAQMLLCILHNRINVHSFKHSFHMFNMIINRKYIFAEVKIGKSTYLMMNSSATSYVVATFHPTIGQCAP